MENKNLSIQERLNNLPEKIDYFKMESVYWNVVSKGYSELLFNVINLNVVRTALMNLEYSGFLKAPDYFLIPDFIKESWKKKV